MVTELADLVVAGIRRATASFAPWASLADRATNLSCGRHHLHPKHIASISVRQAAREGFEFDDEILTLFERFEVV